MQRRSILSVLGRFSRRAFVAAALLGVASGGVTAAHASDPDFRVIVHSSNGVGSVERDFAADIFLKKVTRWPGGETVKPVDLRSDNPVRRRFSDSVLKRSVGAVRSYWQQRIFSGRDVPPPELESDEAVVAYVARNAGAVGYVSGGTKLNGVRELALR
jgi:ABC-type phosphate transport system substrate-binding protein